MCVLLYLENTHVDVFVDDESGVFVTLPLHVLPVGLVMVPHDLRQSLITADVLTYYTVWV